jgi:uncharacterized protein (DUF488 family)
MSVTVFSIGHSTHEIGRLIELLRLHGIEMVADVRSKPFSRRQPQFNRERVAESLQEAGIAYEFLGRELGGRPEDSTCYLEGRVSYERLARTALFQSGLDKVMEAAGKKRVALMCAEKDPAGCHRAILVGRHLHARGAQIAHILSDGGLESQEELLARLRRILKLKPDMFVAESDLDAEAYRLQGGRMGYKA